MTNNPACSPTTNTKCRQGPTSYFLLCSGVTDVHFDISGTLLCLPLIESSSTFTGTKRSQKDLMNSRSSVVMVTQFYP